MPYTDFDDLANTQKGLEMESRIEALLQQTWHATFPLGGECRKGRENDSRGPRLAIAGHPVLPDILAIVRMDGFDEIASLCIELREEARNVWQLNKLNALAWYYARPTLEEVKDKTITPYNRTYETHVCGIDERLLHDYQTVARVTGAPCTIWAIITTDGVDPKYGGNPPPPGVYTIAVDKIEGLLESGDKSRAHSDNIKYRNGTTGPSMVFVSLREYTRVCDVEELPQPSTRPVTIPVIKLPTGVTRLR